MLKPKLCKIFQIVLTSFPVPQTRQWNPSLPQRVTRPHPRNNQWIRVPWTRGRGRRGMPNRCPLSGPLNTLNQRGMEGVCASEFSWKFKSLLTMINFLKQWKACVKLGARELPMAYGRPWCQTLSPCIWSIRPVLCLYFRLLELA